MKISKREISYKGVARLPYPQSKCCFKILGWNLAEIYLNCIILVTNFQKSPSSGSSLSLAPLNLQFCWPEVTWGGQILFFQADYDEIELQKISYDVILVTSWPLCHRKTSSKNVTNFSILAPAPSHKICGYASDFRTCCILWKKRGNQFKFSWNLIPNI